MRHVSINELRIKLDCPTCKTRLLVAPHAGKQRCPVCKGTIDSTDPMQWAPTTSFGPNCPFCANCRSFRMPKLIAELGDKCKCGGTYKRNPELYHRIWA